MVMELARFWRHIRMSPLYARRSFPAPTLDAIEREVGLQEKRHRGEIRFVVEAELTSAQLWRDLGARERARQVFAEQGVWNTEENTGVLIYLLLADRRVEIVADRGITARVAEEEWQAICRKMEAHFREGRFEEGALAGIRAISDHLAAHFPGNESNPDELSNRPVLI
jgi:uncharacterized membrane protein